MEIKEITNLQLNLRLSDILLASTATGDLLRLRDLISHSLPNIVSGVLVSEKRVGSSSHLH
jgi:hypothetical protein